MKSKKKVILLIVLIIIVLIAGISIYEYAMYKHEINAYNAELTEFNTDLSQYSLKENIKVNKVPYYENEFKKRAEGFKSIEISGHTNTNLRENSNNNYELATYLENRENLLENYEKICLSLSNESNMSSEEKIENLAKEMQNLVSSKEFVQMESIYNNSAYVKNKIGTEEAPQQFQNDVNGFVGDVNKLVGISNLAQNL